MLRMRSRSARSSIDPVGAATAPAIGHRAAARVTRGEDVFADLELGKVSEAMLVEDAGVAHGSRCLAACRVLCRILHLCLSRKLRLGFPGKPDEPQRSIARSTISQIVPSVVRPLACAARMNAHSSLRSGLGFTSRTNRALVALAQAEIDPAIVSQSHRSRDQRAPHALISSAVFSSIFAGQRVAIVWLKGAVGSHLAS